MHQAFLGVEPANIEWREIEKNGKTYSAPYSPNFDDIYFNTQDGIAESQYVFLRGNDLEQRFLQQPCQFSIFETGFGSGLNFLLAAKLWQQTNPNGHLNYYSVEQFPITPVDLRKIYKELNLDNPLIDSLLEQYPSILPGIHPVIISECITLYLIFYPLDKGLKEIAINQSEKIDAWFLDGFAPSKNPTMWHKGLWHFMALKAVNNTKQKTTVATFTAASEVRKMLQHYGFEVIKRKGYGYKREMLTARFEEKKLSNPKPDLFTDYIVARNTPKRIAIIGAGLAGAACAYELNKAGLEVDVYDKSTAPASGASKMPAMLATPNCSIDHNAFSQLTFAGMQSLTNLLGQKEHLVEAWQALVTTNDKYSEFHIEQYYSIYKSRLGTNIKKAIDTNFTKKLSLIVPAVQLNGPSYCDYLLSKIPPKKMHFNTEINSLEQLKDYDSVIICTGHCTLLNDVYSSLFPSIMPLRGQLTETKKLYSIERPINHEGHLFQDQHSWYIGATFDARTDDSIRAQDDLDNIRQAKEKLDIDIEASNIKSSYAGIRASTYDRFPYCGLFSETQQQSIWLNYGYGTRGLNLSLLGAQIIKASLINQTLPISKNLLKRLTPKRLSS
ncbi:tRNA (5-methylaminomethyl-2-thiouridine)(34)-methyltransferase MnmD [Kangiella sp. HZ709]|uniref:tRNA (5-methylaminomethyl-2-thiouridine)(34)-methyltransferase MnmD n=1 Tax=Kangiella sp. HZ709 TaxID=2666328 RepID=UPI0012AF5E4E|nr:tRNA (5-methylaminomethyl-2-thiouridine)(34)-methyltransferase MnmD [Kangiella sp. HZ709]MRX26542.1 tRNA (5-methylaminomethyl-2-thiouridine)(34)-methyltransferase MnmD [Kangiella sp. HZ709]